MAGGRCYSMRCRLMVLLIGLLAVLWLGASVVAFEHAVSETDELFDAQMVQASDLLLGLARGSSSASPVSPVSPAPYRYEMPLFYQLMDRHGDGWRVLAHSASFPGAGPLPRELDEGFSRVELAGAPWRVFVRLGSADDGRQLRVVVGQRYSIRDDLTHEFSEHLAIPLVMVFPLMAVAIWWGIGRAMRPVSEAARFVSGMRADDLKPVALAERVPDEIVPLIDAINVLTERVARTIENERRFTADAAHELRTPLAALKVHAQVAGRISEPDERSRVLGQVMAGVERMTHLVEQLLALARLEPGAGGVEAGAATDLAEAAALACADLAPRAMARRQEVQLRATQPARARVDAVRALALICNLVDNALRYGPDGARVEVAVRCTAQGVELSVMDDGPGVEPARRGRLLERFYRGADADAEGCGLGLSIVSRIVDAAAARIEFVDGLLRPDGGFGLGVRVQFPAA